MKLRALIMAVAPKQVFFVAIVQKKPRKKKKCFLCVVPPNEFNYSGVVAYVYNIINFIIVEIFSRFVKHLDY